MSEALDDLFNDPGWNMPAANESAPPQPGGEAGEATPETEKAPVPEVGDEPTSGNPPNQAPVPLTREDSHNAEYLEREFGANVRYDHPTRRWYVWHKGAHRWKKDESGQVPLMVDTAARRRARDCVNAHDTPGLKIAMSLFSMAKQKAAIEHLQFHAGIAVGQQHWDMNTDLFCVRNGVLELPTGTFRPGTQLDNVTKQSPVIYDPTATCPRWMQFLREVFVTDEMIEYVRTIVGYCMTGLTREQVWFLLYGTGGNGKSVFVSVLEALFAKGEYYEQASADTFILAHYGPSGGHNIAQLRSARLVIASEVSEKASFDGARIKQLTGSDPVTAAAKYENNVTFVPQLKLMMLVNHLPSTRDDSLGFWRRLRAIPFEQVFVGSDADQFLTDTLLGELPGILNWAVSGARDWYATGLAPVPGVAAALVEEYRSESDPLALFVHECVVVTQVQTDTIQMREFYRVYSDWSKSEKKAVMSETNFGRSPAIKGLGFGQSRTRTGSVVSGIKVFEPAPHAVTGVKSHQDTRRTTVDD